MADFQFNPLKTVNPAMRIVNTMLWKLLSLNISFCAKSLVYY